MRARIKSLFNRAKALAIGEPTEYTFLFREFGSSEYLCNYWTQSRLEAHHKTHPGPVVCVGCPFIPESEWLGLGTGPADGIGEPPKERLCPGCEHSQLRVIAG